MLLINQTRSQWHPTHRKYWTTFIVQRNRPTNWYRNIGITMDTIISCIQELTHACWVLMLILFHSSHMTVNVVFYWKIAPQKKGGQPWKEIDFEGFEMIKEAVDSDACRVRKSFWWRRARNGIRTEKTEKNEMKDERELIDWRTSLQRLIVALMNSYRFSRSLVCCRRSRRRCRPPLPLAYFASQVLITVFKPSGTGSSYTFILWKKKSAFSTLPACLYLPITTRTSACEH